MKKLIVFDMDGTLADTSPGILNSHRFAHKKMNRVQPKTEVLQDVIGGPLLDTYITRFDFTKTEARLAVNYYRSYYEEKGLFEAQLYPGMIEALSDLKKDGYYIGVATLKAERFVKIMLESMGVAKYFDVIFGMDDADTRTKSQLIGMCMDAVGVDNTETIMIGDSIHDLKGAEQAGVDFIGLTYGFGFKSGERLIGYPFCDKVCDLVPLINSMNLNM